ncbi:MAG TPA: gliding motility-associated C-terminal domain-containing protein [Puia sp.]|nr:gliding motility-associated C-terminal domain-containing protein [Puia sp.]
MAIRKLLIILWVFLGPASIRSIRAQSNCTVLGQTPQTAFPVCGSNVFVQDSVPICYGGDVPVPVCGTGYGAINPYWYKFTCFKSGTLGLLISPSNPGDDYDWEVFDVTGQQLGAVFQNVGLVVVDNWSGVSGNTGTSALAANYSECGSTQIPATTPPPFSKMPNLIQGHSYLLLISHFSGSGQSGYQLSFGGGTASITDTTEPAMTGASAICNSVVGIRLNKKMACSSLTATGSEFSISPMPPGVQITGAAGNTCNSGFDMDSVTLTLSAGLPAGSYKLTAIDGSDGNTLLDVCGTPIPTGAALNFAVRPVQPTPLGTLMPPGCSPTVLTLAFHGPSPILCSSIAADGSDFAVTGPGAVSIAGATGVCDAGGFTDTVLIRLSGPIQSAGSYQLNLRQGSDGNTLLNYCGINTPPGSVAFSTKDTVSAAAFSGVVRPGCKQDTIIYTYPLANGVNSWLWEFDGQDTSHARNPPPRIYAPYGNKTVSLVVSNGVCSDSTQATFPLVNGFQAKFEGPEILCPRDYAKFVNYSTGAWITTWSWSFGDGTTSDQQAPPDHLFPQAGEETKYPVTLVAGDSLGCKDTATQVIDVLKTCFIAVPGAFTPNGDGVNDYLYPLNALKAVNLEFRIYNRWGQLVFETTDWLKRWDGTIGGQQAPAGVYVWMLSYVDGDTGKRIFQKGTSLLIR